MVTFRSPRTKNLKLSPGQGLKKKKTHTQRMYCWETSVDLPNSSNNMTRMDDWKMTRLNGNEKAIIIKNLPKAICYKEKNESSFWPLAKDFFFFFHVPPQTPSSSKYSLLCLYSLLQIAGTPTVLFFSSCGKKGRVRPLCACIDNDTLWSHQLFEWPAVLCTLESVERVEDACTGRACWTKRVSIDSMHNELFFFFYKGGSNIVFFTWSWPHVGCWITKKWELWYRTRYWYWYMMRKTWRAR